jgi:hypothetical protein
MDQLLVEFGWVIPSGPANLAATGVKKGTGRRGEILHIEDGAQGCETPHEALGTPVWRSV